MVLYMLKLKLRIKKSLARRRRKYYDNKARDELKENRELWREITAYTEKSGSTGCSFSDYLVLYCYIRTNKPKEVLECGTGVSTLVMAHALAENEKETGVKGKITSMEELESWYNIASGLMPAKYNKYVDIILSPVIEDCYALFRGTRYKNIPDRPYEFVFIDGPKARSPVDGMKTFGFDIIRIIEKSKNPVFSIIDTRFSTCWALRNIFGKDKFLFDYKRNLGFLGPCTASDLKKTNEIISSLGEKPF